MFIETVEVIEFDRKHDALLLNLDQVASIRPHPTRLDYLCVRLANVGKGIIIRDKLGRISELLEIRRNNR